MKIHSSLPYLLLLSSAFTILPFDSQADSPPPSTQNATDVQSIDQQIESLETQLARLRRNMLNSEIHAQTYMIDNWHEFAEDINRTENNEQAILSIKKEIQALKDQKKLLIENKTPPSK